jgi:hypothetical protein
MRRVLATFVLIAGVTAPAIITSVAAATGGMAPLTTAAGVAAGRHALSGLGIRLVDAPTATADDPRARTYIIDHLKPGTSIDRRIEVINGTRTRARISIYPAAATIKNGSFVGAPGPTRNDLSTWTSTSRRTVTLAPRRAVFVHVTISVPSNASPGERYAVIWAQETTPPATPGGPIQVSRVGIRIYLSIGPGGTPASDFDIVSLTAARDPSDAPLVQASIHNTGGRALDLSGTLSLSKGPGGLAAGPFPITLGTTLGIGQTEPVSVTLNKQLPNGPWLATLTVMSGLTQRTAHATITFPRGPGVGRTVPTDAASGIPQWAVAAVAAAVLIALLLLLADVMRRRRRTPEPQL